MQITYVVDTSNNEDRTYLEFWYKEVVYSIPNNDYIYAVQDCDFKTWEQENIDVDCPRIQIHSNTGVPKP